ncbi:hypothetical protein GBN32_00500, partial [Plesiomonas shigelloides]|uniref:prophage tail fiber N-terminal domain-containing protein n=1 Tax=Plesiomonas shigelloides TaxID=703 RepID=UPI0013CA18F2
MSILITGQLIDGAGHPMAEHEIQLHALRNSSKVVISSSSVTITDADGFYAIDAQPGLYRVDIKQKWKPAYNVGEIAIYIDSPSGTLNDYLLSFGPSDLKPDVVRRFEQLVAHAESAAQSAAESKNEAAKFTQTAEEHATQATQAQQAVTSSAEQVRHDAEMAVACAEQTASDAQKALAARNEAEAFTRNAEQSAQTCADLAKQVTTDKSDVAQSASAVTEAKQEVMQLHDQVVTL